MLLLPLANKILAPKLGKPAQASDTSGEDDYEKPK